VEIESNHEASQVPIFKVEKHIAVTKIVI